MKKPIFLLGAHKSGTSLLRSLLDCHPQLFVIPFEAHFFQISNYWVDYRFRKTRPPYKSIPEAKHVMKSHVKFVNESREKMTDSLLYGKLDIDAFEEKLRVNVDTFSELIDLYVRSIHFSLFHSELPDDTMIVEKSVENAEFAQDIIQMYPDAKFVHIVRNPYANLVSIRRYISKRGYPFIGNALLSLNNSFYYLYRNQRLIENYMIIKYEDLVTQPDKTIKRVADYLGIDFTETLLLPTSLGESWGGNSSRGIQFEGISPDNLNIWHSEINHLEKYYINRLFKFLLDDYDYKVLPTHRSPFWPVRGERPKAYILNRSISYYIG